MRSLKFRAWDIEQKTYEHEELPLLALNGDILASRWKELCEPGGKYIIEQYTGLKDKNGREVYEGDVVEQFVCGVKMFKGKPCGRRTIWQVRWNEYECCFELHYLKGSLFGDSLMNKDDELEVIGNVHEDKELLLKEKMIKGE